MLEQKRTKYADCPSCGYKKALSITPTDSRNLYHCHAGCSQADILAVLGGDLLGHAGQEEISSRENADLAAYIRRLWDTARPPEGTVVAEYFLSRGLGETIPKSIRFVSSLSHKPSGTAWPVMLSAVTDFTGQLQGLHRIYLSHDGRSKAPIEPAKMTLGQVGGHAVHLQSAGHNLIVTEGIENGLAIARVSEIPVWSALSAGGIRKLMLPPLPLASEVTICGDTDENGCGQLAAYQAARRWHQEGRTVKISLPPIAGRDFNDLLQEGI
jgi:hypothetical protein